MTENIDTSAWINTRIESLIPVVQLKNRPDMQGEIDNDGNVTKVYLKNKFIAWQLVEMGFIEECDYYDAMVFMDLRRAYESSQGVKWRSIDSGLLSSLGLSAGEALEYYDSIKHELGLPKGLEVIKLINIAMTEIADRKMHEAECNVYRIAFGKLIRAMPGARKKIEEKKKKVLEYV